MQKVIIRPATPADLPSITRIYADAVVNGTATFEIEPPDQAEMTRRQAALLNNGYPYLTAEIEGVVAGYAYAGSYRARPAYNWSVEDSVYTATAKESAASCSPSSSSRASSAASGR